MKRYKQKLISLLLFSIFAFSAMSLSANDNVPEVTYEGLELVENSEVGRVWVRPGVDFSVYKRILLLEPDISFRRNWLSRTNSGRSPLDRVSSRDMARIIERAQELMFDTFAEVLEEGGFPVVLEFGDDVLVVRLGILDLDVAAPDNRSNLNRTYVSSAGSATLFIELFDAKSRQILARAYDTRVDRSSNVNWRFQANRVTNTAAGRRVINSWAVLFRNSLERVTAIKPEEN